LKIITENTAVSLSVLAVAVGGIFWITSLYFETHANSEEIKQLKEEIKVINRIDRRLSRIEYKLGIESKNE
jgi:hypothetical protein